MMDPRYHVAALREVPLFVGSAQSAHGTGAGTVTYTAKEVFRDVTDVLLSASIVFTPAIAAAVAVIIVIKQVHTVL